MLQGKNLQAIDQAINVGRNQIVYNGNPYVHAKDGLYEMVEELERKINRPADVCFLVVHGTGRGIKVWGQDWVSSFTALYCLQ